MVHDGPIKDFNDSLNGGIRVCTSTTRPTNPFVGQHIYETDTDKDMKCSSIDPTIVWTEAGGSGGGVQNPMTEDLDTGGFKIKSTGTDDLLLEVPPGQKLIISRGSV